MHHAFGFAGRARSVNDEKRPVGLDGDRRDSGSNRFPECAIVECVQRIAIRNARIGQHIGFDVGDEIVGPAIAAVLDDVIAGVAHDDHIAYGMPDVGQLTGHGGPELCNNFRGSATLALKR